MLDFDKKKLSELLVKAQGHRTREAYANEAGVSLPQVSKFIKMEVDGPPRPSTLAKLASKAHNEITYDDLMVACGYYGEEKKEYTNEQLEAGYFRVMKEAKEKGFSPDDVRLAVDFLERAKNRDK